MNRLHFLAAVALGTAACTSEAAPADPAPGSQSESRPMTESKPAETAGLYALKAESLEGETVEFSNYRGTVSLVVNVASQCGYTPQYTGLQKLHAELAPRGFQVLGFPSNDFGRQEPGTAEEIRQFCSSKYSVEFPMFAKVATKGDAQSPVYAALGAATGELPSWNFCKYLVGKDGEVLGFWKAGTAPDDAELRKAIEAALGG